MPDLARTGHRSGLPWTDHAQSLGRYFLHDEFVADVGHDGYVKNWVTIDLGMAPDGETFESRNPLENRFTAGDVGISVEACSLGQNGSLYRVSVD